MKSDLGRHESPLSAANPEVENSVPECSCPTGDLSALSVRSNSNCYSWIWFTPQPAHPRAKLCGAWHTNPDCLIVLPRYGTNQRSPFRPVHDAGRGPKVGRLLNSKEAEKHDLVRATLAARGLQTMSPV